MSIEDALKYLGTLAGGGALVAVVQAIRKPSSQAEMIEAAQEAARSVIAGLHEEVDRLHGRVERLETENAECRQENAELRGQNRQLEQRFLSLEAFLRRNGIDVPPDGVGGSFTVIENDRVTVMKPQKPAT